MKKHGKRKAFRLTRKDIIRFLYFRSDVAIFLLGGYLKIIAFSLLVRIPISPLAAILSLAGLFFLAFLFSLTADTLFRTIRVVFWDFLLSLLIVSDLVYSRYFSDVVSWPALYAATQLTAVKSSVKALFGPWDFLFFADLIPIAFLLYLKIRNTRERKRVLKLSSYRHLRRRLIRISSLAVLMAVIVSGWAIYIESPKLFGAFTENRQAEYPTNYNYVANMGILNFHVFDTALFLRQTLLKPKISPQQLERVQTWFNRRENPPKNEYWGIARGDNVILLLVESLQEFVIGLSVNGQPVTPHLNALALESVYFKNFFHQTAQGRTIDAEFVSQTSLYPLRAGSVSLLYPLHEYDSIAKVLKKNQYFTVLAQAFKSNFWNEDKMSRTLGFDSHLTEENFDIDEIIALGLSDVHFLGQMAAKIEKMPEPFFSVVVTLSSHHPYDELPEQYRTLDVGKWRGTMMGDYLQSAHYTDEAIGQFLEKLKQSGLYGKTVLAVCGDHDAGLNKKELATIKNVQATELNSKLLDKVPMIIHIPQVSEGFISEEYGGTLDITPTLLYLLGIDCRKNYFMGRSLFAKSAPSAVVFRNGSALNDSLLYLQSRSQNADGTCYELPAGKRTTPESCNAIRKEARRRLDISDLIIQANLLEKLKRRKSP